MFFLINEIIIYLLFTVINLSLNNYIYHPNEVINFLNELKLPQEDMHYIMDNITKILNDGYAFYEIAKNPPQPENVENYHNIVDIKKELEEIKIENKSYYEFWKDINKVLSKLRDAHLVIDFLDIYKITHNFEVLMPIRLELVNNYNNPRIYGRNTNIQNYNTFYSNYEEISNKIEANKNIPIRLINGKNPFDFISEFNNDNTNYRSPHANFPLKYKIYFQSEILPFSPEDLNNLIIEYDNNDILNAEYIIKSDIDINNYSNEDIWLKLSKINISNNKKYINQQLMNMNNIFEEIDDIDINSNKNKGKFKFYDINDSDDDDEEDECDWDFCYLNSFKCKVDKGNNINVYYIQDFLSFDPASFRNIMIKCAILFDNNTYPIVLIDDLNTGGSVYLSQFLLETLSPLSTSNIYYSIRNTDILSNYFKQKQKIVYDLNTCNKIYFSDLLKKENTIKVNYGNNINDILSPPFMIQAQIRKSLDIVKSQLKNKRKPTDIMVLTDGYSFSAASILIKYLQYYGGGIIVGYYGHPNKKNIPYDSSISPSAVFSNSDLEEMSDEFKKFHDKYKISIQVAGYQTYYHPKDMSIPLEYLVTPVDEVFPLYEFITNNNYEKFINIAKNIFNKYKNNCNPKNKKLVKVSSDCDKYFENKYTHGGYQCGNDGKWSSKCVPSYCDPGFIFYYVEGKCLIDNCSSVERIIDNETHIDNETNKNNNENETQTDNNKKDENNNNNNNNNEGKTNKDYKIIAIIIISSVLFLVIIIIIIVLIFMKKKKKDMDYDEIQKISLIIQDRDIDII